MTTNSDDGWRNSVYPLFAIIARTTYFTGGVIGFASAPHDKALEKVDIINKSNEYLDHVITLVGLLPDDIILVLETIRKQEDVFKVVCDIANSWTPEAQKKYDTE